MPTVLSTTIPWTYNATFYKSSFKDDELDDIYIDCSTVTPSVVGADTTWLTSSYHFPTGKVYLRG
jgi:hypothetical protein